MLRISDSGRFVCSRSGKRDVLEHVDVGEQRAVLKQHAHAQAQLVELASLEMRDIDAIEQDLAAVRLDLAGDQAQQRRLARAARPHDGRDAAARNRQVQTREDRATADRIMNVANLDEIVGRGRLDRQRAFGARIS